MEEGQSPSASSAHNSGSDVSVFPRPTVARQALNPATTSYFGATRAPATAVAAEVAAAQAPAPPNAPLSAPRRQQYQPQRQRTPSQRRRLYHQQQRQHQQKPTNKRGLHEHERQTLIHVFILDPP